MNWISFQVDARFRSKMSDIEATFFLRLDVHSPPIPSRDELTRSETSELEVGMFCNEVLNDLVADAVSNIVDRNINVGLATASRY